jgi:hypothetical protein
MERPATSDDIARLEERIEALNDAIARCRKVSLASKIAIAVGAAWLVLTLIWIVPFVPALFFASLAALIGGIVLLGSNATTWTQTEAALAASEAMRRDLIEQLRMRVVEDRPTFH